MIALCILLAVTAIVLAIIFASDVATQEIELEIEMVPGDIDPVLESFKVGKGVDVAGLIGTDFLEKYGYIIDFEHKKIFHKFHSMSFKEAMELLRIPYIVLWQGGKRYIFIVDTGSAMCHISTKALKTIEHNIDKSMSFTTLGCGEEVESNGLVKAKFHYK